MGEPGILIVAAVFRRKHSEDDEEDMRPLTGRAAYVFDTAQTDPLLGHEQDAPKRPEMAVPVLTGEDGSEPHRVLLTVAACEGISVSHDPPAELAYMTRQEACMGFYSPRHRAI
jgi:hypothetical protein